MLLLALLLVGAWAHDGADAGQSDPWSDDDDDADFYHHYNQEAISSTKAMSHWAESQYTRVRRNDQTTSPVRTLSPDEIREVKGVLNKMMEGRDLKGFTPESATEVQRLIELISSSTPEAITDLAQITPLSITRSNEEIDRNIARGKPPVDVYNMTAFGNVFRKTTNTKFIYDSKHIFPLGKLANTYMNRFDLTDTCLASCTKDPICKTVYVQEYYLVCEWFRVERSNKFVHFVSESKADWSHTIYERLGYAPTTTLEPTTSNTTAGPTTAVPIIDIRRLVQIIANLTMNTIESNLTELFNATLQKYGIPMCGETTTEDNTYDFANATIVAKCFVCGLETPGIPHNAYCADAFAGDFLPLVPVDPKAKGQIARYRKYCRYLDVPGTIINETQPRSVFGRWSGGCSVRWIDLSGVYTQRACRNRRHAVMGQHYVSKRMAKLEMALKNEDNGCIISPMSSLVPLSRGISLYARFHACVCTGSWCNGEPHAQPRSSLPQALAAVALAAGLA